MEPDRTLEDALATLRNISDTDLDALLHYDSPPFSLQSHVNARTSHSQRNENAGGAEDNDCSLLHFNREPFPSQIHSQLHNEMPPNFKTDQLDLSLNFTCAPPSCSEASVIMSTQTAEPITLDETEQLAVAAAKKNMDAGGATECVAFQDFELDLSLSDIDFAELDELERKINTQNATCQSQSPKRMKPQERLHKTQLVADGQRAAATQNISTSCPLPSRVARNTSISPILADVADAEDDPMNYLALSVSNSSQSAAASGYNQMQVSSTAGAQVNTLAPLDYSRHKVPTNDTHISASSGDVAPQNATTVGDAPPNLVSSFVADATLVPPSVKQLYDLIKAQYSDFAFVYALSAQLCQERVPMDCFVNLKMGLLLSLASIGPNPDRPPIPVIAMGNDTCVANYMLTNIGQLAPRFVGPVGSVKPPSSAGYRNHNWIEADPILLAKGGVFFVGDWSRIKLARADELFRVIECSRVTVERCAQSYPLEAAIWTHWRSFKCNAKDQQTFNKIVKIFGIPICMDDDNHEVLVTYILEQSSTRIFESTVDQLSISSADMRDFLAAISRRSVDLTPEASLLLQKYFVAARIERPECLTKQAFVILKQFAESFAKLAFRHEVLQIDAVAAIFMCERFILSVYGANENSPPTFESHNFVGSVDKHLTNFQKWLRKYIEKFHDKE